MILRLEDSLGSQKMMGFVATTDAGKAKAFYGGILGLRLVSEDGFALVFDVNGTMLRVQIVAAVVPHPYTSLGWAVGNIAALVGALSEVGVRFEVYAGMGQDAMGVWASPSGAKVAWFKDPDGNVLSLTQF